MIQEFCFNQKSNQLYSNLKSAILVVIETVAQGIYLLQYTSQAVIQLNAAFLHAVATGTLAHNIGKS